MRVSAAQATNSSLVPRTWLPLSSYSRFMEDYMRFKGYDQASNLTVAFTAQCCQIGRMCRLRPSPGAASKGVEHEGVASMEIFPCAQLACMAMGIRSALLCVQIRWLTLDAVLAPSSAGLFKQIPPVDTVVYQVNLTVSFCCGGRNTCTVLVSQPAISTGGFSYGDGPLCIRRSPGSS